MPFLKLNATPFPSPASMQEMETVEVEEAPIPGPMAFDIDNDEVKEKREICWDGCGRPSSVCICSDLPSEPIPTSTRIIILHHPHELRNKLATVPILTKCLLNCHTLPGRHLRLGSSPLLDSLYHQSHHPLSGSSSKTLFLFPGSDDPSSPSTDLAHWASQTSPSGRNDHVLIVFDGTWNHAKEMVAASLPFLSRFARRVSLGGDAGVEGESMFDSDLVLRKEPFRGCMGTMEAVARALRVLEPECVGVEIESRLLSVLRKMVRFQACHLKPVKPRPRLRKKKDIKNKVEEEEEKR